MNLTTENNSLSKSNFDLKKKHADSQDKLQETTDLLQTLKGKYDLVRDLNLMYRRFYSRNVIDQIKKDDFEMSMDAIFKDFNMAMQSKDNFIA